MVGNTKNVFVFLSVW